MEHPLPDGAGQRVPDVRLLANFKINRKPGVTSYYPLQSIYPDTRPTNQQPLPVSAGVSASPKPPGLPAPLAEGRKGGHPV